MGNKLKVVICVPTITKPHSKLLDSIKDSVPVLDEAGVDHKIVFNIGSPYISNARATMLRKALDAGADQIIFLDHDVSFPPHALLKLIQTEGDVVACTYRYKKEEEEYMGVIHCDRQGFPIVRKEDGCIKAEWIPAGFMKITTNALGVLMKSFPELCYGSPYNYHFDLFQHGAHKGVWYGEDYAFSRRCGEVGVEIWLIPNLDIDHNSEDQTFKGNYHMFLRRRPGGDLA